LAKLGDPTIMARMTPIKRWSSADLNAAIARTAPDVVALLGDGVPRAEAAIVAALADRQPQGRDQAHGHAPRRRRPARPAGQPLHPAGGRGGAHLVCLISISIRTAAEQKDVGRYRER
jgi:hypothetical protein